MTALQRARKLLEVTIEDLADSAGLSLRGTNKHLRGEADPGVTTALKYAHFLQRQNRMAGFPMRQSELTPNALFGVPNPSERGGAAPSTTKTGQGGSGPGRAIQSRVTAAPAYSKGKPPGKGGRAQERP